jgi:hypothetical protein
LDVLGVICARFGAQPKVRAGERGPQFGYQLLSRIRVIAEALA